MNRSPWGRPRNDLMHDLQSLALWVIIIGVVGYLLFPGFFQDVWSRITLVEDPTPVTQEQTATTPAPFDFSTVFQEVYGGTNNVAELSKGYWAIFVRDGQFEQLPLSDQAYAFVGALIEKDQANGKQKLILTANGQVQQVMVSDEVYDIITKLSVVNDRTQAP